MNPNKRKSLNQENKVAKDLSARTVVASGAMWGAKGDVRSDIYLVECKITYRTLYRLTFNCWEKIRQEAIKDGMRIPVLVLDLEDGMHRVVVVDTSFFDSGSTVDVTNLTLSWGDKVKSLYIGKEAPVCFDIVTPTLKTTLYVISWERFLELRAK